MIIIQLIGGLGNQMFQYAIGRKLALEKKVDLKLDISNYDQNGTRIYRLNKFNIIENIAAEREIQTLKRYDTPSVSTIPIFLYERLKPYYHRHYIKERSLAYDPNITKIRDDVYLSGYWQTEKYFFDIRDILIREFSLVENLDTANLELLSRICEKDTVSLHIRRGDYVTNPEANQYHGICSIDYYQKAIDFIGKKIESPYFFIFSDDMIWVKRNFPIAYPHEYVTHNGEGKDYIDLMLMMHCKHHIIANSSFSWWGAWLGENGDKIIIAPKKWFHNPSVENKDLLPQSWHKL